MWTVAAVLAPVIAGLALGPWLLARMDLRSSPTEARLLTAFTAALPGIFKAGSRKLSQIVGEFLKKKVDHREQVRRLVTSTVSHHSRIYKVEGLVGRREIWGIHESIQSARKRTELPTYVERDFDEALRDALTQMSVSGGFLLMTGRSASGKSRSAYEALKVILPNWNVLFPADAAEIVSWMDVRSELRKTVVWLDDIAPFLAAGALTPQLVRRLLSDSDNPVILIASIWPAAYESFIHDAMAPQDVSGVQVWRDNRTVLSTLVTCNIRVGDFTNAEWERATKLADSDEVILEALRYRGVSSLPEILANKLKVISRWQNSSNSYGAAVVAAAVAIRRCGVPWPVSRDVLEPVASSLLTGSERAQADPDKWFEKAVEWATTPVEPDSRSSPLNVHAGAVGGELGWRASDMLVDYAVENLMPIPDTVWPILIESSDIHTCEIIAYEAHLLGSEPVQRKALQKIIDSHDDSATPVALVDMALLELSSGRLRESQSLLRESIRYGSDTSMGAARAFYANTAYLMGDLEDAEANYRLLADNQETIWHSVALLGLVEILIDRGDIIAAEEMCREVIEIAYPGSLAQAMLLTLRIRGYGVSDSEYSSELVEFWEKIDFGDTPFALVARAQGLIASGQNDEAKRLLRESVKSGDLMVRTFSHLILSGIEFGEGRLDLAESHLLKAADSPIPRFRMLALTGLGDVLVKLQRYAEAEQVFREILNYPESMGSLIGGGKLAQILIMRGELEEATALLQRASESRHPETASQALLGMAHLKMQTGPLGEAETYFRKAAERTPKPTNAAATFGLAETLVLLGRIEEARTELEKVIQSDVPGLKSLALARLGFILIVEGDRQRGWDFLQQAIDPSQPAADTVRKLQVGLARLVEGEVDLALQDLRDVASGGDIAVAPMAWLQIGLIHQDRGELDEAEQALDKAAASGHPMAVPAAQLSLFLLNALRELPPRVSFKERIKIDKFLPPEEMRGDGGILPNLSD